MPRYRLTVAYEGTNFHGWQKQCPPDASEPLRTVQATLEDAAAAVAGEPVNVVGASRTDAGVHALGQVAAFTCAAVLEPARLAAAINARLPAEVQVRDAAVTGDDFSPITDAVAKGYRYRIAWGRGGCGRPRPLFGRATTFWTPYVLDAARMNEAARRLIGTHDFASFTRKQHNRETTVRTIHDCMVTDRGRRRLRLDVCGDGFLYNMVRIIAGTLIEVGRGRIEPEAMAAILAAADREAAGPTVPPEGLFLRWVRYPDG